MTDVRISSAVMTHPHRLPCARELAALLGLDTVVVGPDPDGPPRALRAALVAWAAARGATHHLVLHDDAATSAFLRDLVRRSVRRHRLARRVRAAAVATLGFSSLLPEARQSLCPDQAALLKTYVRSGLWCGRAWLDEASHTAPRQGGEAHDA